MARLRRKILWCVTILGLCLVSLLGLAAFVYRDERPPADQDLTSYRRAVPDAANGFTAIDLGMDDVSWPEEDEHLHGTSETFDADAARKVVAENESMLRKLDESLTFSDFQVPEAVGFDFPVPYLYAWRNLAFVSSSRARLLLEDRKEKQALAESLKLVRFGCRIQDAQGVLLCDWVGRAIQSIGLRTIVLLAGRTPLAPEELKPIIQELGRLPPSRHGFRDSCRAEYCFYSALLDAPEVFEMTGPYRDLAKSLGQVGLARRLLFQPNRTRRLLAEDLRRLIDAVSRTHAEAEPISSTVYYGPPVSFFAPGGGTKALLGPTLGHISRALIHFRVTQFEHAATRTLLALKAFEAARGRLPGSLDELVPDYLEAVPLDPFDGKPLRWSAERKLIHSVGEDLVDSGGSAEVEDEGALGDRLEPTLRIEAPADQAPR